MKLMLCSLSVIQIKKGMIMTTEQMLQNLHKMALHTAPTAKTTKKTKK